LSSQPGKAGEGKPKLVDPSTVVANLRDLTVHLHRANVTEAKKIAAQAAEQLQEIVSSDEPDNFIIARAQQTLFAIEEVRIMLSQDDVNGALAAARDAAKEWRQQLAPAKSK
jgi:rRNA-processing protein FCF1